MHLKFWNDLGVIFGVRGLIRRGKILYLSPLSSKDTLSTINVTSLDRVSLVLFYYLSASEMLV